MTINLSEYVGKVINYRNRKNKIITGKVSLHYFSELFPYEINGFYFNNEGLGYTASDISVMLDGIAHQVPNINLQYFVGQTVHVKFSSGNFYTGTLLLYESAKSSYLLNNHEYKLNGEGVNGSWNIVEIYGEGAYEINTKGTFDLPLKPENPKIKQVKELLNEMTEDEVAKLIKSLKS